MDALAAGERPESALRAPGLERWARQAEAACAMRAPGQTVAAAALARAAWPASAEPRPKVLPVAPTAVAVAAPVAPRWSCGLLRVYPIRATADGGSAATSRAPQRAGAPTALPLSRSWAPLCRRAGCEIRPSSRVHIESKRLAQTSRRRSKCRRGRAGLSITGGCAGTRPPRFSSSGSQRARRGAVALRLT